MNKILAAFLVIAGSFLVTGATYWVAVDDMRYECVGQDGETNAIATQVQRGFPVWFYKDPVPAACNVSYESGSPVQIANPSQFRLSAVLLNALIWSIFFTIMMVISAKIHRNPSNNNLKTNLIIGSYGLLISSAALSVVYGASKDGAFVVFGWIFIMILALIPWLAGSTLALAVSKLTSRSNQFIAQAFLLFSIFINILGSMVVFNSWIGVL